MPRQFGAGMRCFSTRFGGKNWIHISAELY
jgi:hypothetical protein